MNKKTKTKPFHLKWFILFVLGTNALFAEGEEDAQKVIDALTMRQDIGAQLETMSKWEDEVLLQAKVKTVLDALLKDDSLTKRAKLSLLDFHENTLLTKRGFDKDVFGEHLVKMLSSSSPSLQKRSFEILIQLDGLKSAALKTKIEQIVSLIFSDASREAKDQKFPAALHAIALKAFKVDSADSKQVKSVLDLFTLTATLSPTMKISLFQITGSLFSFKPAGLSKVYKTDFAKAVAALLQNHPGALAVGASPSEIEELEALLYAIQYMIADKDLDDLVAKVQPTLMNLLSQPDFKIARASGDALIALQMSPNNSKVKNPVAALFLGQLSNTMKEKLESNAKAVYLSKSLAKLMTHFIVSDEREEKSQIDPVLKTIGSLSFYPIDIEIRLALLDAYFAIEPRHFSDKKILSLETKKILETFFTASITYLQDPQKLKDEPKFAERLSSILYEMTGHDLGPDGKQWGEWLRREGKEIFN